MNSDLRRWLKALADDMKGTLRPIPFDRVLHKHLYLFEGVQARNTSNHRLRALWLRPGFAGLKECPFG
jgi:hypothetical protein